MTTKESLRRHWRAFLPFWLFPVVFMTAVLISDFIDRAAALRPAAFILCAAYSLLSFFWPARLYFRREISWSQAMLLYMPFMGVWVALVLLRAIVFTIIGKPL